MTTFGKLLFSTLFLALITGSYMIVAGQPVLDQSLSGDGEWGYHPAQGSVSQINPPSFTWRPQGGLLWELECATDTTFDTVIYSAIDIEFNVHCPPQTFESGSQVRSF